MSTEPVFFILDGQCAGPRICPLSRVQPGTTVCVKQISAGPELGTRLREMGIREEQQIKLVASQTNYICQVCNARLGISHKLAESILVETVQAPPLRVNRKQPARGSRSAQP